VNAPGTPPASLRAFDAKAQDWEAYTHTPLGRLRQELTQRRLAQHLDACQPGLHVLDAGGGTGSYALPLAQIGHSVCLVDASARMLAIARQKAEQLDPALLARVEFCCAPVEALPDRFRRRGGAGHFDLVLCHTLLEYVPDPWATVRILVALLKPGGLLSLLCANPHADPLRWAIAKGDLDRARQALDETVFSADLFGLARATFTAEAMQEALAREGVDVMAAYGVPVFADYLPADRVADPTFYARLLALESQAGARTPYRLIARYNHLVGRKRAIS
jgi:S-adenosylmethionine-dependent methyltransferase